jgi:ComEC/Rec2-related protein
MCLFVKAILSELRKLFSADAFRPIPALGVLWFLVAGALPPALVSFSFCGLGAAIAVGLLIFGIGFAVATSLQGPRWQLSLVTLLGAGSALLHGWAPWRTYDELLPKPNLYLEIRAIVTADRIIAQDDLRDLGELRNVTIQLTHIRLAGGEEWQPCAGQVLLENPGLEVHYGSQVEAAGALRMPRNADLPGALNYARHLRTRGILHVFRVENYLSEPKPVSGWRLLPAKFANAREALLGRIVRHLEPGNDSVLAAMTLGYRQGMRRDARNDYLRSGMIHLFAISGLHVGILYTLLLPMLALCRLPFRARYALAPLLLAVYVIACGAAPSAVRAWLMISVWSLARAFCRTSTPVNATLVAACVLIMFNPYNLFRSGFQFSFAVVLCLIRGWQFSHVVISAMNERQAWIPARMQANGLLPWLRDWLAKALLSMAAAWIGGIGLTAFYNGLFLPAAILTNTVACLLAWGVIAGALVKLGIGLLLPEFAELYASAVLDSVVDAMRNLAVFASEHGGVVHVPRPALVLVLGYYLLLATMLLLDTSPRRLVGMLTLIGAYCCAAFLVPLWVPRAPAIHVIAPAESNVPLVVIEPHSPGFGPILINTGPSRFGFTLDGWLRYRGIGHIQQIVALDNRVAHFGAAQAVLEALPVDSVTVMARDRRRLTELQTACWQNGARHHFCFSQDSCEWPDLQISRSAADDISFFTCELRIDIDHRLRLDLQELPNAASHLRLRLYRGDVEIRSEEWTFPFRDRDRAIPFH